MVPRVAPRKRHLKISVVFSGTSETPLGCTLKQRLSGTSANLPPADCASIVHHQVWRRESQGALFALHEGLSSRRVAFRLWRFRDSGEVVSNLPLLLSRHVAVPHRLAEVGMPSQAACNNRGCPGFPDTGDVSMAERVQVSELPFLGPVHQAGRF